MTHQNLHILTIADSPEYRKLVSCLLREHAVVESTTFGEFESRLETGTFDLTIIDFDTPGVAGLQVIARLQEVAPDVPVIALAAEGNGEVAVRIIKQGAADCVSKSGEQLRRLPAIVHAVLARIEAQRAAKEAEARFRRLAENAPDIIFRWSYAHGYEYVSPAAAEVVGYTPAEHYADPGLGYRVIHPDDLPIYESVFSDLSNPEGTRRHCVVRWHHKDGHIVHVEMHMTPIFDERGELVAIEGISRDISQHVLAKEQLRELSSRAIRAEEEERRCIARELHDEVGQALTAIKMGLRMTQRALPEDGAEKAHSRLDQLVELVDQTIASVRALSHELRPPLLDEVGVEPALAWLCDGFSQHTGLSVRYVSEPDITGQLSPDAELAVYRIVQEALTNAARHAQASQVTVLIAHGTDGAFVVTIEDDGCGFDVQAVRESATPNRALGLLGMQERADLIGGQLTINSGRGKGTSVRVRIPRQEPPL